ncbi:uncharacterized protein LOC108051197 [Drosophila rhopaloa]|uniref:Uncharacterized protein LOC108051197 n=1 Tax=Drosophila rhopaloa TaxID=1041015 RepID=A0A6P4FU50_DRORH|nr:uncharacterized protein LOC108051197 [Drosophila rhopaloa]
MKLGILVAALFWQSLLETHGLDHDHAFRTCEGPVFYDCQDYCRRGCSEKMGSCVHQCLDGCGCMAGSIIRNNGGCKRVFSCKNAEADSASVENQDFAGDYVTDWWSDAVPIIETALKSHPELAESASHQSSAEDEPKPESADTSKVVEPALLSALEHPEVRKVLVEPSSAEISPKQEPVDISKEVDPLLLSALEHPHLKDMLAYLEN